MWDPSQEQSEKTLSGHTGLIYSLLKINRNQFVSGGYDLLVKLWDLKEGIYLKTLTGHTNYVEAFVK